MVEVERAGGWRRRKESARQRTEAVRGVQRVVEVALQWTVGPDLYRSPEAGDPNVLDVHRRGDRRSRHGVVIDAGAAHLVITRELGDDTKREPVDVPDLVEVVAFGKSGRRHDSRISHAGNGAQVLDVRREEQPSVVEIERVGGIGKEVESHARTHLMLVARERRDVRIVPHAGSQLEPFDRRDRGLYVHPDVVPGQLRIGYRSRAPVSSYGVKQLVSGRDRWKAAELQA